MIRLSLLVQFLAEGYAENLYQRFGTQYVLCHSTPRTFARHDFSALSTFAEVDSIKVLALEVIHLNSFCLIGYGAYRLRKINFSVCANFRSVRNFLFVDALYRESSRSPVSSRFDDTD